MMNKKAFDMSFIIKAALIIILGLILFSTLTGLFGHAKQAVKDFIKKEYKDFDFSGDTLYNPSLPLYLREFWDRDYSALIRTAVNYVDKAPSQAYDFTPCLGGFSVQQKMTISGVQLSFVQYGDNIDMFLRDSKNVVGTYDNYTFQSNPRVKWRLCVMEPAIANELGGFVSTTARSPEIGRLSSFNTNSLKQISSVRLKFTSNDLSSDNIVEASYYTKEILQTGENAQEEKFTYQPWEMIGDNRGLQSDFTSRYIFLFAIFKDKVGDVETNYFCIVPSSKNTNDGLNIGILHNMLVQSIRTDASTTTLSQQPIEAMASFCKVPSDPYNGVGFGGLKRCFYYSCNDVDGWDSQFCTQWFQNCPGLCAFGYNTGTSIINYKNCLSCGVIDKCVEYKSDMACNTDLCGLNCKFVYSPLSDGTTQGNCKTTEEALKDRTTISSN